MSVWVEHAWRLPRYLILALLLIGTLAVAVLVYRECSDETTTAANGDVSVVTTCGPPDLSSAIVLIVLLMVVGLLWPDLAQVTVLGVGLTRQVNKVAQAAATATKGVESLTRTIELQQVRLEAVAVAAANATVTNTFNVTPPTFNSAASEKLQEAAARVEEDAQKANVAKPEVGTLHDTELRTQVISAWERLNEILDFTGTRFYGRPVAIDSERKWLQQAFIDDHSASVRIARELRNAVAHAREVTRQDLTAGVSLIEDLIGLAEKWFEDHGAAPRV